MGKATLLAAGRPNDVRNMLVTRMKCRVVEMACLSISLPVRFPRVLPLFVRDFFGCQKIKNSSLVNPFEAWV